MAGGAVDLTTTPRSAAGITHDANKNAGSRQHRGRCCRTCDGVGDDDDDRYGSFVRGGCVFLAEEFFLIITLNLLATKNEREKLLEL